MASVKIDALDYKVSFQKDMARAPEDIRSKAVEALKELMNNPQPAKLRLHSIQGCFSPRILKIDVFPNRSWQITFEMDGTTAVLRRLARHRDIDRRP